MYVGYAVLDGKCYRFSTPQALDDFMAIYPLAMYARQSIADQYDGVIHNGHDMLK
jgi:hypothetical protein